VDPIILSVGEEDEVSIADVARGVAKAMDFKGNVVVSQSVNREERGYMDEIMMMDDGYDDDDDGYPVLLDHDDVMSSSV